MKVSGSPVSVEGVLLVKKACVFNKCNCFLEFVIISSAAHSGPFSRWLVPFTVSAFVPVPTAVGVCRCVSFSRAHGDVQCSCVSVFLAGPT